MLRNKLDKALQNHPTSKIHYGGEQRSYAELTEIINAYRAEIELHSNDRQGVIISLDKSFESLALVLACVLSKRVYIAIDSKNPLDRIEYILEKAKPAIVYQSNGSVKTTDETFVYDDDCCSVLFTSGSTGTPKGVMVKESGLEVFAEWCVKEFNIDANTNLLSVAGFHFDLSTLDIFAGILSGADITLLDSNQVSNPKYVNQVLTETSCNLVYATPSWYTMQLSFGGFQNITFHGTALFAGEVFPINNLNKLRKHWPEAQYYNLYGPSETNVVSYFKLPKEIEERTSPYPIGIACPYAQLRVEEDELLIGGDTLMTGYVGEKEFKDDYYRSGDRVSEDEGVYTYTGRLDRMIKHRGNRIEPSEIEIVLLDLPSIEAVHVFRANHLLIAAYAGEKISVISLKQYCSKRLLAYMIPDRFEYLSSIPFNANGKMDTKAIEEMLA